MVTDWMKVYAWALCVVFCIIVWTVVALELIG